MEKVLTRIVRRACLLNEFLANELNISKTKAKQLIDQRNIFVNQRRTWIASFNLKPGDKVELPINVGVAGTAKTKIQILYEDEQYLIINKISGLLSNGPGSAEELLREQLQNKNIYAVHRLDKDTSGLLVFAKSQAYFEKIKELFRNQEIKKIYRAIASSRVSPEKFIIDTPLDQKKALTRVKVLASNKLASYLELEIATGRTHQIRLHLQQIGHPLLGEKQYDNRTIANPLLRSAKRQMLHAYKLEFINPYSQKNIIVKINEPEDFQVLLKKLEILSRADI